MQSRTRHGRRWWVTLGALGALAAGSLEAQPAPGADAAPEATPGADAAPEAAPGADAAPEATPGADAAPEAAPGADAAPEATPSADAAPEATPGADATPGATPSAGRVVNRAAAVSMRSFTPQQTYEEALRALEGLGAYTQSSAGTWVELRVPTERLDEALARLDGLGEVTQRDVKSEDVTLEMVTQRARVATLEESRQRTLRMLEGAVRVSDSLVIERSLEEITGQLEAAQGRLRYLQARADETPLRLEVSMRGRASSEHVAPRRPFPWTREYGIEALLDHGGRGRR